MQGWRFKKINKLVPTFMIAVCLFLLVTFLVSPARPFLQNSPALADFNQVWQTVNTNFYDPKFNGVDWKAMREKYEPLIKQAQSIDEGAVVINEMLAELKTSHTRFYTQSEPAYYQLLGIFKSAALVQDLKKFLPEGKLEYTGIGIFTQDIQGKTFIKGILEESPASKAGLEVGDQILAVDGQKYQPIQSFVNQAGKEVKISIQRHPEEKDIQEITVIPKKLEPNALFLEAMRASTEVIERGNHKLGYIHVWSYAGDQYQQLLVRQLTYGKLREADGLIIDLRDGWGGASPDYLSVFTAKIPTLTQVLRDGTKAIIDYQWKKPVVMLVNSGTRSGKEILAYGFQQYNIGAVVGTKTAGAVVGGRPFLLVGGNFLYLAVVDVFTNGKRLEGEGVTPDVEVFFQLEYAQGTDSQKEKALEVLDEAIKTQNPAT